MEIDPNSPTQLHCVPSEVEAAALVAALAERGIQAMATGGYTSGFRAEAPGWVSVVVKHADLELAKQALAEIQKEQAEIDWSQVDIGEPEDGET